MRLKQSWQEKVSGLNAMWKAMTLIVAGDITPQNVWSVKQKERLKVADKQYSMNLTAVCSGCGSELTIEWKPAYTDEHSFGIQVAPCKQCSCECALCRKPCPVDKLLKACKAVKVRIAFIGHPNEPKDWSKEVALIEQAEREASDE